MTKRSWCFNGDGGTTRQEGEWGRPIRKKFTDMTDDELQELSRVLPGTTFWIYADRAKEEIELRASTEKYGEVSCDMKIR